MSFGDIAIIICSEQSSASDKAINCWPWDKFVEKNTILLCMYSCIGGLLIYLLLLFVYCYLFNVMMTRILLHCCIGSMVSTEYKITLIV